MTTSLRHENAFHDAIRAAPDDDTPRLVYADWLMERADPRGEFIHVQCLLDRLAADDTERTALERRARALYSSHRGEWERPFDRCGRPTFVRGFVEGLTLDAEAFLAGGEELFRAAPLRQVWLKRAGGFVAALAESPCLARLSDLNLSGHRLSDSEITALARSPHLGGLSRLTLMGIDLSDEGLQALAKSPTLSGLIELNLQMNRVGAAGVRGLADSLRLDRVASLNLFHNRLDDEAARILATCPRLSGLRRLHLGSNRVGRHGAMALAEGSLIGRLDVLNLRDNLIGSDVRQHLRSRFGERVVA